MKLQLTLGLLLTTTVGLFAQSKRTFNVQDFDRLRLSSAFVIDVKPGTFSVTAEGENKEDVNDLEASVKNNTLHITFKEKDKGWWQNHSRKRINLTITMPSLRGIDFSGATRSHVSGFAKTDQLDISINGASHTEIEANANVIRLDVSGASNTTITGSASEARGNISGASKLNAEKLKISKASVDISGASNAHLYVTEQLNAQASGASRLRYKGGASVSANTSGASSVRSEE